MHKSLNQFQDPLLRWFPFREATTAKLPLSRAPSPMRNSGLSSFSPLILVFLSFLLSSSHVLVAGYSSLGPIWVCLDERFFFFKDCFDQRPYKTIPK